MKPLEHLLLPPSADRKQFTSLCMQQSNSQHAPTHTGSEHPHAFGCFRMLRWELLAARVVLSNNTPKRESSKRRKRKWAKRWICNKSVMVSVKQSAMKIKYERPSMCVCVCVCTHTYLHPKQPNTKLCKAFVFTSAQTNVPTPETFITGLTLPDVFANLRKMNWTIPDTSDCLVDEQHACRLFLRSEDADEYSIKHERKTKWIAELCVQCQYSSQLVCVILHLILDVAN